MVITKQYLESFHEQLKVLVRERKPKTLEEMTELTVQYLKAQPQSDMGKASELVLR